MGTGVSSPKRPRDHQERRSAERAERAELLGQLQEMLEPVMVALGLVFLGLLVVEYAGPRLTEAPAAWLGRTQTAIYWVFVADFVLRFVVAPEKGRFLRANWLGLVSLALPALRPLRALRGLRAVRSLRLLRLVSGANRGMGALRRIARGRQFAYVAALSVAVTLLGAVGARSFERGAEGATIVGFGEALWWAGTLVTTINSGNEPVTFEGRVIGVLLRLYAVSVFGLVTASIATYFIGRADEGAKAADAASVAPGVVGTEALRADG